jgi:D-xylose reductase
MFPNSTLLNSGYEMPLTGYGLWDVSKAICADQVYAAVKEGYRCFDGACGKCGLFSTKLGILCRCIMPVRPWAYSRKFKTDYGNEVEAGQGIARAIQDGLVQRSELFIVSKLWCTFHDPKHVQLIARKQLSDWELDYFDLYLIHFPVSLKYVDPSEHYPPGWAAPSLTNSKNVELAHVPMHQTWKAMESLVKAKLTRSIGISNFHIQLISDLLCYACIIPAVLQIEHHPYLTQRRLVDYSQEKGIVVTAYCSFGPQSAVAAKLTNAAEFDSLLDHRSIKTISRKYDKASSQVLLRWATQRGIAVIPKSRQPEHMRQNLDMGWNLSEDEIEAISALDRGLRLNDPVLVSDVT